MYKAVYHEGTYYIVDQNTGEIVKEKPESELELQMRRRDEKANCQKGIELK